MTIKHSIDEFVNLLSSHPFYKATGQQHVLDFECFPIKPNAKKLHYIEPYTDKTLSYITDTNSKGYDVYYRLQYHRVRTALEQEARPITDRDITNVLFLLLDIDFRLTLSIDDLMAQMCLKPWAIVQTSVDEEGFKRYQVLVAIDPADSQKLVEAKKIGRKLASVIGSDNVYDYRRLARLAGTINWKWSGAGVSMLIDPTTSRDVYTLAQLETAADEGEHNDALKLVKANAPQRRKRTTKEADDEHDRLTELTCVEALEVVKRGEVVAHKGNRNTSLNSYVGGYAQRAAMGEISIEEGRKAVMALAVKGVDVPLTEKEIEAHVKSYDIYVSKDSAERERVWEERTAASLARLAPVSTGNGTGTGNGNGRLKDSEGADKSSEIERNRKQFFDYYFSNVRVPFMKAAFSYMQELKKNSGNVSDITWLLINRALELNLIIERFFCIPIARKTVWGTPCHRQQRFTGVIEEGLIGQLGEELYKSIQTKREVLEKDEEIAAQLAEMKTRLERQFGDSKEDFRREWSKAKVDFFKLPFPMVRRRDIQKETGHTISEMQEAANVAKERNAIAFQNGWLILPPSKSKEKAKFIKGEAWKDTLSCMDTHYDVDVAERTIAALQGSNALEDYKLLLAQECKQMYLFLEDTFPGQVATWMAVFNIIGYCFLAANPLQVFFSFQGAGGSGKGSLCKIITYLCGEASCYLSYSAFSHDANGLFECIGKCICGVDEVDTGSLDKATKKKVAGRLKEVTGGTPIQVRTFYKNPISVKIGTKFILISNEPLDITDTNNAIGRRLVSLKFKETVAASKQVEDIALDVLRMDADKIASIAAATVSARWSMGREMLNVTESEAMQEGANEYLETSSPIKAHLLSLLVPGDPNTATIPICFIMAELEAFSDRNSDNPHVINYIKMSEKHKKELVLSVLKARGLKRGKDDRMRIVVGCNDRVTCIDGPRLDFNKIEIKAFVKCLYDMDPRLLDLMFSLGSEVFMGMDEEAVEATKLIVKDVL